MNVAQKQYESFQALAKGTNVNGKTLLATDYLNHFNEALMLAELVTDMPDMLDEFLIWEPRHYKDHFRQSGIADKDLAIQAYDHVPKVYKEPFESTINKLNRQLLILQKSLSAAQNGTEEAMPADLLNKKCGLIRALIDVAGGIINGNLDAGGQKRVENPSQAESAAKAAPPSSSERADSIVKEAENPLAGEPEMSQADIDSLFD